MEIAKRGLVIIIVVSALVGGLIGFAIGAAQQEETPATPETPVTETEIEERGLEEGLEVRNDGPDEEFGNDEPEVRGDNDANSDSEANGDDEAEVIPRTGPRN